ncbi:hypothetical protein, partial [Mycolicibacterium insubricum]|uniref:hypothetical protein n=1 Tax=Mycolicibacterium insubricum TaxID=444597 RepID=UPI0021F2CE6A
VATERGALALPLVITEMPDAVVWVPLNSGVSVADRLGVGPGAVVRSRTGTLMQHPGYDRCSPRPVVADADQAVAVSASWC